MPKNKKAAESSSDSDSGPDDRTPAKKSKPASKSEPAKGESTKAKDGEPEFWTLEKMRRVRINEFRGRKMVDIREYYEKGGEVLPGKKGICLSALQWNKLMEYKDEITEAIKNQ